MKNLRIGFLLEDHDCPQWQLDIIDRIEKDSKLDICFVGFNGEQKVTNTETTHQPQSLLQKCLKPFRQAFSLLKPHGYGAVSLYHRLDAKRNAELLTLWHKSPVKHFPTARTATLIPNRKGFTHRFSQTDIKTITDCNLDVLIRFGFSIIRGEIHHSATYGVWSFHHGDNRFYRGGPPGIWELIKGQRQIAVTLQQLNDTLDCGKTIGRYIHRGDLFSALKNKQLIYSSCGDLLLNKLQQTQKFSFKSIQESFIYRETIRQTPILKSPKNIDCFALIKNLLQHYIELRWPRNKKVQWYLAVKPNDKAFNSFNSADLIIPPLDRFYADPFLFEFNNKTYVFFEECFYKNIKAHISVGELKNNQLINIQPIIEEDFHLSYPCIFTDDNEIFLIPESRKNKSLRLYRCTDFPYKWHLDSILMQDVELLDATIHKQDDTYFLFCNQYQKKRNTSNEQLVVYFSDNIRGPWQSHPLNPLAMNITNSRPAGKIFEHENKLILPTQNCARRYGHIINFNIIIISKTQFSMEKISSLSPKWQKGNLGSHTWNSNKNIVITDAHRYIDI